MWESRTYGSGRGARGNSRPYREVDVQGGKIACRTFTAWTRRRSQTCADCVNLSVCDFAHADRPSSAPLPTLQFVHADKVIE
jgi:hypothetical protein